MTIDIRILRLESKAQRLNSPRWNVCSKCSSLMVLEGEGSPRRLEKFRHAFECQAELIVDVLTDLIFILL